LQENISFAVGLGGYGYGECYTTNEEFEAGTGAISEEGAGASLKEIFAGGLGGISDSMNFPIKALYYILILLIIGIVWYFLHHTPLAALLISFGAVGVMCVFGVILGILTTQFVVIAILIMGATGIMAFKVIK
jgi:hypothetical protein